MCCGRITVGVSNQTGLGEAALRTVQAVLQVAEVTRVTATGHGLTAPHGHGSGHAGDGICHLTAGPLSCAWSFRSKRFGLNPESRTVRYRDPCREPWALTSGRRLTEVVWECLN